MAVLPPWIIILHPKNSTDKLVNKKKENINKIGIRFAGTSTKPTRLPKKLINIKGM